MGVLASLALLLPTIAVSVRRLHDSNLSGWWLLLPLLASVCAGFAVVGAVLTGLFAMGGGGHVSGAGIAITLTLVAGVLFLGGFITWLVLMLRGSAPGPNRFGPTPRRPWTRWCR